MYRFKHDCFCCIWHFKKYCSCTHVHIVQSFLNVIWNWVYFSFNTPVTPDNVSTASLLPSLSKGWRQCDERSINLVRSAKTGRTWPNIEHVQDLRIRTVAFKECGEELVITYQYSRWTGPYARGWGIVGAATLAHWNEAHIMCTNSIFTLKIYVQNCRIWMS